MTNLNYLLNSTSILESFQKKEHSWNVEIDFRQEVKKILMKLVFSEI